MPVNELTDTLKARRDELVNQSQTFLQNAINNGRSAVGAARSTLEEETRDVLGRVRELEHQGREVLSGQLDRLLAIEERLWNGAESFVNDVRPEVAARVPALSPVVDRVEGALKQLRALDDKLHAAIGARIAPIEGYDELNARDVIAKVEKLNAAELTAVRAYEAAHKNRKTVLRAIDEQLSAVA